MFKLALGILACMHAASASSAQEEMLGEADCFAEQPVVLSVSRFPGYVYQQQYFGRRAYLSVKVEFPYSCV